MRVRVVYPGRGLNLLLGLIVVNDIESLFTIILDDPAELDYVHIQSDFESYTYIFAVYIKGVYT